MNPGTGGPGIVGRAVGHDGYEDVVGVTVGGSGGEPGVLAWTVREARRHGASGQLPFAALVARDGVVIGVGATPHRGPGWSPAG